MPSVLARAVPVVAERLPALDGREPSRVAEAFRDLPGLVLLESARPGRTGRWSFLAADPFALVDGTSPGADPFEAARHALSRLGGHARLRGEARAVVDGAPPFSAGLIGYLAYDVGRRLERMPELTEDDQLLPDVRLALHPWSIAWDARSGAAWLGGRAIDGDDADLARRLADVRARAGAASQRSRRPDEAGGRSAWQVPALRFASAPDRAGWRAAVDIVRRAIAEGELYQANLARRLVAPFDGDPWPLFQAIRAGEPAAFAAYIDLGRAGARGPLASGAGPGGRRAIISASPEPFLALDAAGRIRTDPVKGTRPRGATAADDRRLAAELLGSAKDRAENTTIVDVLRNDLGRVCRPGSVRVPRLCRLERTASVQHLVSTVTGRLAPGKDAFDLLRAAMPGGSITGAPKIRAMQLIEEVERVRRGPYCGAGVWIDAGGAMGSSILIRTMVADGARLTLHVGGGITWRSDAEAEWEETRTKARGLLRALGATVDGEGVP